MISKNKRNKKKIINSFCRQIKRNSFGVTFCLGKNKYRNNIKMIERANHVPYCTVTNNIPIFLRIDWSKMKHPFNILEIQISMQHTTNLNNDINPNPSQYTNVEIKNDSDLNATIFKFNDVVQKQFIECNSIHKHINITNQTNNIKYSIDNKQCESSEINIPIHFNCFFNKSNVGGYDPNKLDFMRLKIEITSINIEKYVIEPFVSDAMIICKTKSDKRVLSLIDGIQEKKINETISMISHNM